MHLNVGIILCALKTMKYGFYIIIFDRSERSYAYRTSTSAFSQWFERSQPYEINICVLKRFCVSDSDFSFCVFLYYYLLLLHSDYEFVSVRLC